MAISVELRKKVIERAGNCCEYCLVAADERLLSFHVDHILAVKHGGQTDESNLCYACYKCNGFKGSNIAGADPQTSQATFLFTPRKQNWDEHFKIKETGLIEPLSAEGRVTVFMLRINDKDRVEQRHGLMQVDRYPCKIGS